jgi:hypothetical protein
MRWPRIARPSARCGSLARRGPLRRRALGGGRFAVAPGTAEDAVPDWMVFAAELIADRDHLEEPGRFPDSTSLKEEGFDPAEDIVSTFASYIMLYFDRWTHEGFDAVGNRYLMRIDPPLLRGVRRIEGDRLVEITPSGGGKRFRRWPRRWPRRAGATRRGRSCDALPRTIRLDPSDRVSSPMPPSRANGRCRAPSCSGAARPTACRRKEAIAFRSGFLGVDSFGHSTLVTVQEARPEERAAMVETLARQLVAHLGAPSVDIARPAAEQEVALAESLCEGHGNTLIALHRRHEGWRHPRAVPHAAPARRDGVFRQHLQGHDRAFQFFEEEVEDHVDLFQLRGQD